MILVDASAVIELLMGSAVGSEVDQVLADEVLIAPEIVDVEVASALARLERASTLETAEADKAMRRFAQLPLHRISHRQLSADAWKLRHFVRTADSFYVACARQADAAFLTLDRRLIRAAPEGVRFVPIGRPAT